MCFHIFSENNEIDVLFASEQIELHSDGKSEILIDIIVQNKSPEKIQELCILYPKAFYNTDRYRSYRKYVRPIEDLTHTVLNACSPLNKKYNVGDCRLKVEADFGTDHHHTVRLELPNHSIPYKEPCVITARIEDVGIRGLNVVNTNEFGFHYIYKNNECQSTFIKILHQNRFSILQYYFTTEMKQGESRFVRLRIGAYRSVLHKSSFIKERLLEFFENLSYRFEIVSPYDVLHRFICKTHLYKNKCISPLTIEQRKAFSILFDFIDKMRESKTTYNTWRMCIWPNGFKTIRDITLLGNINVIGTIPNEDHEIADEEINKSYHRYFAPMVRIWSHFRAYKIRRYVFETKNSAIDWEKSSIETLDKAYGFRMFFTCTKSLHIRNIAVFSLYVFSLLLFFGCANSGYIPQVIVDYTTRNPVQFALLSTFIAVPTLTGVLIAILYCFYYILNIGRVRTIRG